ncbi:MAG: ATP-dependent 6-phosphofructokinase [Candidatus Bathyarchaeota archaeon B63]|nr:MAG: ATP-dependent 6-phosphofructokinase [Candidatus Bathyarchaeota archaeon B63]
MLCYDGEIKRIPAVSAEKIVDLTGAGDTYVAGFILEYLRTGKPGWSALFASGVASFTIEGLGTSTIPTREDVLTRLKSIKDY